MWLWLWIIIQFCQQNNSTPSFISLASAGEQTGAFTAEEGPILWEEGRKNFEKTDYEGAARLLQKLVDKYPGSKGYLHAHLLLGKSYLVLGKPEKAIAPLKYFNQAHPPRVELIESLLYLGRAFLSLHHWSEALLVSKEMLDKGPQDSLKLSAYLLKSESLIGLNSNRKAGQVLDSFDKEAKVSLSDLSPLVAQAFFQRLRLKTKLCQTYPNLSLALDEGSTRTQFKMRGQCLLEGLNMLKTGTETNQILGQEDKSGILARSGVVLAHAFEIYRNSIASPPLPKKKLNLKQLQSYERELVLILFQDWESFQQKALRFLADWKVTTPLVLVNLIAEYNIKFKAALAAGN